jgi:hypothetical protein
MLRTISPHAIAHASFCKPHDLRLWRSHGFLDGVGERQGKGHLYSIADATQMRASALLVRCRVPSCDAFEIVAKYRKQIDALCAGNVPSVQNLALIVRMRPTFDDVLKVTDDAVPYAQMVFEECELAEATVNLSAVAKELIVRVNAYQARHAT